MKVSTDLDHRELEKLFEKYRDIVVELQALLITDLHYRGLVTSRTCFEFGSSNEISIKWISLIFDKICRQIPTSWYEITNYYNINRHKVRFVRLYLPPEFHTLAKATYREYKVGRVWSKTIPNFLINVISKSSNLTFLYITRVLEADGGLECYKSSFKIRLLVTCDPDLLNDYRNLLEKVSINYYIKIDTSKLSKGWKTYYSIYLGGGKDYKREILKELYKFMLHETKRSLVEKVLGL